MPVRCGGHFAVQQHPQNNSKTTNTQPSTSCTTRFLDVQILGKVLLTNVLPTMRTWLLAHKSVLVFRYMGCPNLTPSATNSRTAPPVITELPIKAGLPWILKTAHENLFPP